MAYFNLETASGAAPQVGEVAEDVGPVGHSRAAPSRS
jgi:hypothetical protein